jgi:hypothetical protein
LLLIKNNIFNLPFQNNPKIKSQIKPNSYDRKKMVKVEKGEGIWENGNMIGKLTKGKTAVFIDAANIYFSQKH